VVLGESSEAWATWAHAMRFALQSTQFVDIGDTIYRCETVDRIEPIQDGLSAQDEALQACMGVLSVIRDGGVHGDQVRYLCQQVLQTLESRGFSLNADEDSQASFRQT
jgi:hypothetical protein